MTDYFFTLVQREEPLRILSKYHRFISFTLYLIGRHSAVYWFLCMSCVRMSAEERSGDFWMNALSMVLTLFRAAELRAPKQLFPQKWDQGPCVVAGTVVCTA